MVRGSQFALICDSAERGVTGSICIPKIIPQEFIYGIKIYAFVLSIGKEVYINRYTMS